MERPEFAASKEQYTALKQELDEFRAAAGVSMVHGCPRMSIDGPCAPIETSPVPSDGCGTARGAGHNLFHCSTTMPEREGRVRRALQGEPLDGGRFVSWSLIPARHSINVKTVGRKSLW
jgi:hypothetical protein